MVILSHYLVTVTRGINTDKTYKHHLCLTVAGFQGVRRNGVRWQLQILERIFKAGLFSIDHDEKAQPHRTETLKEKNICYLSPSLAIQCIKLLSKTNLDK